MDSVMMPQEGPLLNDENAEPSLMSVNTNKPPWKTPNIRKRIKNGCGTCLRRRIKCDEGKPFCNNCVRTKKQCSGYNTPVIVMSPMEALPPGAGVPSGPLPYHHPDPTQALDRSTELEQTPRAKVVFKVPVSTPGKTEAILTPLNGNKIDLLQKFRSKTNNKNTLGPYDKFASLELTLIKHYIGRFVKLQTLCISQTSKVLVLAPGESEAILSLLEGKKIETSRKFQSKSNNKKTLGPHKKPATLEATTFKHYVVKLVKSQHTSDPAQDLSRLQIIKRRTANKDESASRPNDLEELQQLLAVQVVLGRLDPWLLVSLQLIAGRRCEVKDGKDAAEAKFVDDGGNGPPRGPRKQAADDLSEDAFLASVGNLMRLFSEQPRLASDTTDSHVGSSPDVADGTNELVQLLLLDEELGRLLSSGVQRTGAVSKAERKYTRLLRKFARNLFEEARSPVEQHVANKLVKSRARFISHTLVAAVDPLRSDRTLQMEALRQQGEVRGERIERYLSSLENNFAGPPRLGVNSEAPEILRPHDEEKGEAKKLIKQPVDSNDGSPDESDEESVRPNLSRLKDFVLSSHALVALRARLKNSLSPEPGPELPAKVDAQTMEIGGRIPSVQLAQTASNHSKDQAIDIDRRVSNFEVWLQKLLVLGRWKLVDEETISAFVGATLHFIRPKIPKGHQRITWVCGCGNSMYSDVQELHDGGAAHLEQKLRGAAAAAAAQSRAQSSTNNTATQRQGTGGSSSSSSSSRSGSATSGPTLAPHANTMDTAPEPANGGNTQDGKPSCAGPGGTEPPGANRFLILCVNGPRLTRYQHLPVLPGVDDQVLFQDIRRSYSHLRRDVARSFHPDTPVFVQMFVNGMDEFWGISQKLMTDLFKWLKLGWLVWWLGDDVLFIPKSAQFVRFQLVPVKMDIASRILECSLPPREEVEVKQNYHYAPCPPDVRDDQTLGLPFLHVLLEPGNHLDDFWTNYMPKKLRQELQYQRGGPGPVIGWGVHVVEGPNWRAVAVLAVVFVVVSLGLALACSLATGDVSGAFTVGSFVLAAETLVVTLVLTVITTSHSQQG